MANLLLTTNCQRRCPYCFAKDDKQLGMSITWENFIQALKFIATGPRALNLLGGEPTMHYAFDKMLAYLLENDFLVQVFTNGMVSEQMLEKIIAVLNRVALREDQLYFAVNINEAKYRTEEEERLQEQFLVNMGPYCYPAFTIHENTDLMFLQDIVEKHYLDNTIRLGLAMPASDNKYLSRKLYREVAENILKLARNSNGTTITFDCGFPLCMFSMDEISELVNNEENEFSFICGVPLDIYPDLSITNCYPLSKFHKNNIQNFNNIGDAYKHFEEGFACPTGIFGEKCNKCQFFQKACMGGCKGFIIPQAKEVQDE